jgi:two-component system chemotaxis sensor kinase CheA
MDAMDAIKATFFQECDELLVDLEAGLTLLEGGSGDLETINAVFRAVHSIKGGAGAFGLEALVKFAHVFETTLDLMRSGKLGADADRIRVMLRAADVLADHVRAAQDGSVADEARAGGVIEELDAMCADGGSGAAAHAESEPDMDLGGMTFAPMTIDIDLPEMPPMPEMPALPPAPPSRIVRFKPRASMYANANDAVPLLRELSRLGACEVTLNCTDVPLLDALEPEASYLSWTVKVETGSDAGIHDAFEFVEEDCDLTVETVEEDVPLPSFPLMSIPEFADESPVEEAPRPPPPVLAVVKTEEAKPAPAPARIEARVEPKPDPKAEAPAAAQATIRVDLERVDRLIDLVGELVINQAMLAQRVAESGIARSSNVVVGLEDLEQLTRGIQDSVMAIRAQPVKSVFQRMPRLVREVAQATGKQVRLVTEGENTEVDKTVIERLGEPITHMIRNAIDHGLESPEARVANGKPAEGTVRLAALHRSGRIVIEVGDDGKGIDRNRVRQIACDRGLIDPSADLSDDDIDQLIFLPGFSTASALSDISGRGVGMDVVKRSIQALGGRITLSSRPGKGSTFTLSLPLTLAVLDGMVVAASGQTLIVPLTAIVETLQPKPNDIRRMGASGWVVAVRDAYVPVVNVGHALGWTAQRHDNPHTVALLVETEGGGRAALLVDEIQGQRQVVIKSLEANYQQVEGIAAATILGDGRVALILDVDAVLSSKRRDQPRVAEPLLKQAS